MKAVGIILAGGKNERLGELTALRATSALPVASAYRAIDFPLSSMANSGMKKIAVITQFNSRSLNDHLSSAKWWDLGQKQGGLFTFSPFLSNESSYWFRGTADSIYQNINYLKRSNEPYVIIAAGEGIYKMDFNKALKYHIQKEADITIICKDMPGRDVRDFGVMQLDEDKRMIEFEEKPIDPVGNTISLGIYIISRTLLIKLLETIAAEDRYDFVKDIIIRYRKKLKICGLEFSGYWSTIKDINSYFNTNMDFLRKEVRDTFIRQSSYIETKPKDEPPAKYNIGARAKNVLVGSGSIINGELEKSILFRRVFTGENTYIGDSIIMEGCFIGNNCRISHAIIDKEVIVSDNREIIGTPDEPVIIRKGSLI